MKEKIPLKILKFIFLIMKVKDKMTLIIPKIVLKKDKIAMKKDKIIRMKVKSILKI